MEPNSTPEAPRGPSPNQSIDTTLTGSDNNNQDGYKEIIDRRQLTPINDTECTHPEFVKDPTDETEEFVSMVCTNSKCPVGYLLSK